MSSENNVKKKYEELEEKETGKRRRKDVKKT